MKRPGLGQAAEIRPAARRGAGCATRTRHHRDTFCEWLWFALCNSLPSIWGVQRGPLVAQKLFRKAAPGTAVRASRTDTKHTDNQKWKLRHKASQHHPGDNKEIRKHIWLTLVSLSRNYLLFQSLWGELATTGKQVKKKVPHVLQLRNN